MPLFEIEVSGRRFEVDAPTRDDALRVAREFAVQPGSSQPPPPAPLPQGPPVQGPLAPSFAPAPVQDGLPLAASDPTIQQRNDAQWLPWITGARNFTTEMGQGALESIGAMLPAGSSPQPNATPPFGPPPEDTAGQFGRTIGNFLPGAVSLGPSASRLGNVFRYGVGPGAFTEGLGQIGDEFNPAAGAYARVAGAILGTGGAALAGHAGVAAGLPRSQAGGAQLIGRFLRDAEATVDDIDMAEALIGEAAGVGIPLSWPEALSAVTNGRVDMTGFQRVIEQSRTGAPVMSNVMSARPPAIRAAVETETARLGPAISPAVLGPQIRATATERISDLRQQINEMTESLYGTAGKWRVDPEAFLTLQADDLFAETLNSIRNDSTYGRLIAGFPDNSIAVMDAVKKRLDDLIAAQPGENTGNAVRSNIAGQARAAGQAASPEYAEALATQAFARQNWLAPLENGPLGGLSATDDLARQLREVFPTNPLTGSEQEVRLALGMIADVNPEAAQAVVRHHVENVFNEAAQATARGPNPAGGANFVAQLQGNQQQMRNLQAAFEAAYPDGAERWQGVQRLMQILEATGRRQPPGSPTAANLAGGQAMATAGTPLGTVATTVLSPTRALNVVGNWYQNFLTSRNGRALADIITDPENGDVLRRLATGGPVRDLTAVAAELFIGQGPQVLGNLDYRRSIADTLAPAFP